LLRSRNVSSQRKWSRNAREKSRKTKLRLKPRQRRLPDWRKSKRKKNFWPRKSCSVGNEKLMRWSEGRDSTKINSYLVLLKKAVKKGKSLLISSYRVTDLRMSMTRYFNQQK
jgi:hypothetical protein